MTKKRGYGEGQIVERGENTWLCRYRVGGRRLAKTVHGTRTEAQRALRDLLHAGDKGEHVEPDKLTLGQWIDHWISIGCPGNKRRREVSTRAIERYSDLLRVHVVPLLGARPLQQVQSTEIDAVYASLDGKISAHTALHVHRVLGACFGAAARTRKIVRNPMMELAKVPSPGEADHGIALEADQLRALVQGFKGSSLFGIVAGGFYRSAAQ
jgi:integrase